MRINWFDPRMTGTEASAVFDVLNSGYINDGPVTAQFEAAIADIAHRHHGVAVPSGTVALAMALMAAGALPDEPVIVPDFTFLATANAVRLAGCRPIFADISRETFNLTAESVDMVRRYRARRAGGDQSGRNRLAAVRFIMPVEVNGRALDHDFYEYCNYNHLTVITDSCEALGSGWCGSHGLMSCFSFSPNKLVTTGQGGMIVTDDFEIYTRLRQLKYQGFIQRSTGADEDPPTLGYNFKFTDLQAAIGLEQLKVFDKRREACQLRDEWYRSELAHVVEFPPLDGVHLWTDILTDEATPLAFFLRKHGYETRKFWLPLHRTTPHNRLFGEFPIADRVSADGLWLPSSYDIIQSQVREVSDAIKTYMGSSK